MRSVTFFIFASLISPAFADSSRVTDRAVFVELVSGKRLTTLGVNMTISASGGIGGRAFGSDVTGSWTWSNGYFCRTLKAGSRVFPRNCQVVQKRGNSVVFTADQGAGPSATLRIR